MSKIIGRIEEKRILSDTLESQQSELVVIYGRRRIGKTFLIREFYKDNIVFEISGLFDGTLKEQLFNFNKEINTRTKGGKQTNQKNWLEAFSALEIYLNRLKNNKKKVVFIDEFPWIATPKSKFLMAFENFWNNYCTKRNDLIVVICGSAASYMVQKIINNKGGLHNRISRKIRLLPFNVNETSLFLESRKIKYTPYDIVQLYMAIGGIPHYLDKVKKGLSIAQNIDEMCFTKNGVLTNEFNQLFQSLFENSDMHLIIIKTLANSNQAITRNQLIEKSKIQSGGEFSLKLSELIESGFVTVYNYLKNKKQLSLYRLSDEYSKFYLKFIEQNKTSGPGTWIRLYKTQSYTSWSGFAFETLCLKHINQLKKSLRIDAIFSTHSSWFNENAQIDLLIDRDDNVINLCEIKFYSNQLTVDKQMYLNLKNKVSELQEFTKTRKNIYLTLITTFGVKQNEYSTEIIQNEIDLNFLFIN